MATVDEALARTIIANKGRYADDPPVLMVVSYTNMGGEKSWAILYERDVVVDRYRETEYVREPKTEWAAPVEMDGHRLLDGAGAPVKYGDHVGGKSSDLRVIGGRPDKGLVWAMPVGWDIANLGTRLNLISTGLGLKWEFVV